MVVNVTDEELMTEAEAIVDGWYADGTIDWEDFLYRLEERADVDLGNDADSPQIRKIKAHVRKYRKAER